MTAVVLALSSALLFGAMSVALRLALVRTRDVEVGAVTTAGVAFLIVGATAAATEPRIDARGLLAFSLAGALAPGASQLLFTYAIREVGASRTSAVTGASPLFAVAIAFLVLQEPFSVPLFLGALLVVVGGVLLVLERDRPAHFRLLGIGLAATGALVFAVRDNFVRAISDDIGVDALTGAAVALLAGTAVTAGFLAVRSRGRLPVPRNGLAFVPAGVLFGLSYVALFEAYYRGRVTVVSPLVATESLWGVLLSALVLRRTELVGRSLVAGALLVVAGGALIGVFR